MGALERDRSMVRAMCGIQLMDNMMISKDLMMMLGLNETIDQLVTENSVCWYGDVLKREDGDVLRMVMY